MRRRGRACGCRGGAAQAPWLNGRGSPFPLIVCSTVAKAAVATRPSLLCADSMPCRWRSLEFPSELRVRYGKGRHYGLASEPVGTTFGAVPWTLDLVELSQAVDCKPTKRREAIYSSATLAIRSKHCWHDWRRSQALAAYRRTLIEQRRKMSLHRCWKEAKLLFQFG